MKYQFPTDGWVFTKLDNMSVNCRFPVGSEVAIRVFHMNEQDNAEDTVEFLKDHHVPSATLAMFDPNSSEWAIVADAGEFMVFKYLFVPVIRTASDENYLSNPLG